MIKNKKSKYKKLKKKENRSRGIAPRRYSDCLCRIGFYTRHRGRRFLNVIPITKYQYIFYYFQWSVVLSFTLFAVLNYLESKIVFNNFELLSIALIIIAYCLYRLKKQPSKSKTLSIKKCPYCSGKIDFFERYREYSSYKIVLISKSKCFSYYLKHTFMIVFLLFSPLVASESLIAIRFLICLFIIVLTMLNYVYKDLRREKCQDIEDI